MEIWKDIENFEGLYQISNLGRVKSANRIVHIEDPKNHRKYDKHFPECIKATNLDTKGYVMVTLKKNGKTSRYRIHRLVANAFISNPNNLPQVNHKNEIKTDKGIVGADELYEVIEEYDGRKSLEIKKEYQFI